MQRIRAFIGVPLSDEIRKDIIQWKVELEKLLSGKFKWVEQENLHLSLFFLGNVFSDVLDNITKGLKEIFKNTLCFDIQIKGVDFFPRVSNIHTVWAGIGQGTENVKDVYANVEKVVSSFGFKSDHKDFVPHITIGRAKSRVKVDKMFSKNVWADKPGAFMKIDKICVIESVLSSKGPKYIIKEEIKFE